jgi:4-amino-4-deoxy-L-arabinose transferase-like glycosyltransferase
VGGHAAKSWWYFFPVLLLHFFPLSLAYVSGWRDWRAAWQLHDARYALLVGWCLLVFIFFTLAVGKREVYVLPMLPMLALALAPTLERLAHVLWLRRTALGIALLAGVALVAAGGWVGQGHAAKLNQVMLERGLGGELPTLGWGVAAIGAAWLLAAAVCRVRRGVHALLAGLALLWITWGVLIAPAANSSVSSADVMRQVDRVAGRGEVAMVAWKEQNLLMSPRPLKDFGFRTSPAEQFERAVAWLQEAPAQRWIFANQQEVQACVDRSMVTVVGSSNRREWSMFQVSAVKPGCQLTQPEPNTKATSAED